MIRLIAQNEDNACFFSPFVYDIGEQEVDELLKRLAWSIKGKKGWSIQAVNINHWPEETVWDALADYTISSLAMKAKVKALRQIWDRWDRWEK